jgi:hypothetical protein
MYYFISQPIYIFIKDVFTCIFTIAGLVIAGFGLATWKKQIKGIKEFEASYNLNYSLLKLRDAIRHVRNPAIWPAEQNKAAEYFKNKYPNIKERDLNKNASASVYEMRWEEITNAYTEMESHLLAAEVLWGSEILDKIRPLHKNVTELNIGLKQYLEPELRTKNHEEIDDIVYDSSDENNKDIFSQKVDQSIKGVTDYIKQKIK